MELTSVCVKKMADALGADLCGIAPAERFSQAPLGYSPTDVLPGCKSVVVIAVRFLTSTLSARSTIPYTVARNTLAARLDRMTLHISDAIEREGELAVPPGAVGPTILDKRNRKLRGIISLKHAAVLAGLGKMGKNTLLVNDRYGNMLWLGAVLTTAELEPDPLAAYDVCPDDCALCLKACPVKALDGVSIDQRKCGRFAFEDDRYAGWRIKCYTCRKICPNCLGIPGRRLLLNDDLVAHMNLIKGLG